MPSPTAWAALAKARPRVERLMIFPVRPGNSSSDSRIGPGHRHSICQRSRSSISGGSSMSWSNPVLVRSLTCWPIVAAAEKKRPVGSSRARKTTYSRR